MTHSNSTEGEGNKPPVDYTTLEGKQAFFNDDVYFKRFPENWPSLPTENISDIVATTYKCALYMFNHPKITLNNSFGDIDAAIKKQEIEEKNTYFARLNILFSVKKNFLTSLVSIQKSNAEIQTDQKRKKFAIAQVRRSFKKHQQRSKLFNKVKNYGFIPEFWFAINAEDSLVKKTAPQQFSNWCRENNIDLDRLLGEYQIPQVESSQPVLDAPAVVTEEDNTALQAYWDDKITFLQSPILDEGRGDNLLSTEKKKKQSNAVLKEEKRWLKVLLSLQEIGVEKDNINQIYRYRCGSDDLQPETLIDLRTEVGRAQILVKDHHEIFVVRDRKFKKDHLPLQRTPSQKTRGVTEIPCLLDRRDVWKFSYLGEGALEKDLKKYVLEDIKNLTVQRKHKVAWGDKAAMLRDSFIATVIESGQIPKAANQSLFSLGPLSRVVDATITKGYSALNRSTIPFFKNKEIKSYNALFNYVAQEIPEIKSFIEHGAINAEDVFRTVAHNILENRSVADMSKAFGTAANRSEQEVSVAIRYGGLKKIDDLLGDGNIWVPLRSVNHFCVATGLASNDNGKFELSSSKHIRETLEALDLESEYQQTPYHYG